MRRSALPLGSSKNFSSQIAMTVITAMQYNLLSTAKRFSDYETVGGLFNDAVKGSVELTLTERIWDMILEMVRMIAECFESVGQTQSFRWTLSVKTGKLGTCET